MDSILNICNWIETLEHKYPAVRIGIEINPIFIIVRLSHGEFRQNKAYSKVEIESMKVFFGNIIEDFIQRFIKECKKREAGDE